MLKISRILFIFFFVSQSLRLTSEASLLTLSFFSKCLATSSIKQERLDDIVCDDVVNLTFSEKSDTINGQSTLTRFANEKTIRAFSTIPVEEQLEIKELFRYLFREQLFAFSVYSDKPISFSSSLNNSSGEQLLKFMSLKDYCQDIFENFVLPIEVLKKRWDIWKKYKDRFHFKKYLLIEKRISDQTLIFIINKEFFKKTVDKHICLFRKAIKEDVTAEELLSQFLDLNTEVFDILHNNEGLLGVLLGFGVHNSMLFQQREEVKDYLKIMGKSGVFKLNLVQKRLDVINSRLQPLHEHDFYIISSINRVCFLVDHTHSKTIKLIKKYDRLNTEINEIIYRSDWFEQLLIRLMSD